MDAKDSTFLWCVYAFVVCMLSLTIAAHYGMMDPKFSKRPENERRHLTKQAWKHIIPFWIVMCVGVFWIPYLFEIVTYGTIAIIALAIAADRCR